MCQVCGASGGCEVCEGWEWPIGEPADNPPDMAEALASLSSGIDCWRAAVIEGASLDELRAVLAADLDGMRAAVGVLYRLTGL